MAVEIWSLLVSEAPAPLAAPLALTPLNALHIELGARMVPFAGYSMPVQYPAGLMAEHHHTRASAGLFDVSHMGQLVLRGAQRGEALESLIPMDVLGLGLMKQRYGLLLDDNAGILDDLMFVNRGEDLFVIVNGACKHADMAWMQSRIGNLQVTLEHLTSQALLALQGPKAVDALSRLVPGVEQLVFMTGGHFAWQGLPLFLTRSGYTGEDGFEISIAGEHASAFARALLAQPEVAPIGLGARNSLRLEAGLCLYGNDIDTATNPVEANLTWALQKARRAGGEREGGYPGATKLIAALAQITGENSKKGIEALTQRRVGLLAQERVPVRDGTPLADASGAVIGRVTSGTLGPTCNSCIAIGYLPGALSAEGSTVFAQVRGKAIEMKVAATPFVPNRYFRGPAA